MRIAIVSQPLDGRLPPPSNSIAIWTYEVAQRLATRDSVTVFSSAGRVPRRFDHKGVTFRQLPILADARIREFHGHRPNQRKHPFYTSQWYSPCYALQAATSIAAGKYDIVHIHNFTQLVPAIRRFNPSIKIVLHMHCEWLNQLDYDLLNARLRSVSAVIFCSHYLAEKARRRFPHLAQRLHVVPNGVDSSGFVPAGAKARADGPAERPLLFVGRVSPEKGVHVLLRAFNRVREAFPETRLLIAGPYCPLPRDFIVGLSDDPHVAALGRLYQDDYMAHLRTLLNGHLSDGVTFLGALPHAEMARTYASASVVINPALSEAFGMSLVEGMATGIPVVASRVGGMPEVVEHGGTGLLVPPDDDVRMADAIIELLGDHSLREAMGGRGRQRVLERFDWNRVTTTLRESYRATLAANA